MRSSVMTYGAETWGLTKLLERKLRSAQQNMARKMPRVTLRDTKATAWIREQTCVEDILKLSEENGHGQDTSCT